MADQDGKKNKIYQLDESILDLYNFVYAKTSKYKAKYIDIADLNKLRFKLTDYDLNAIFDKTPIKYIDNFPTGMMDNGVEIEQLWIKRAGETHNTMIRLVPYKSKASLDDMSDPVNVNQMIRTILSELVINDKTNNILLPIVNVDVKGSDFSDYPKIKSLVDNDKYYSLQITENFYKLTTLDNFLEVYPLDEHIFKSIIYQAISVLYQINTSYPEFRYNQFIPQMIDCYLKSVNNDIYPELKLSDFYLSTIGEFVPNNYIKTKKVDIPSIDSPYSDLYQLLNYLWKQHRVDIEKYPKLVVLFDTLLPKKIRSSDIYLSLELWSKLSDEEKIDLRIKNIKNSNLFDSRDSILGAKFVETQDSDLTGGISDDDSIDIADIDYTTTNQTNPIDDDSDNNLDNSIMATSNKKYYNNDIEHMSSKKSTSTSKSNNDNARKNTRGKRSENDRRRPNESDTTDATDTTDTTGAQSERTMDTTDSVEITDTTYSVESGLVEDYKENKRTRNSNIDTQSRTSRKTKPQSARGKRYIDSSGKMAMGINNMNNIPNDYSYNNNAFMQNYQPNVNPNPNDNIMVDGVASRINSIGNVLGATPNDYNRGSSGNNDYSRIAQQMSQFYGEPSMPSMSSMSSMTPGHLPPNMPSQLPSQIYPQGQTVSPSLQTSGDTEALYRYMAAQNQVQNQGQNQIDPSMMSAYMQAQNLQPNMQNMNAMNTINNMQGMQGMNPMNPMNTMYPQMGGAANKPNPFFFQQMNRKVNNNTHH